MAKSEGYFRTNIYTGKVEFVPHPEHRFESVDPETGELVPGRARRAGVRVTGRDILCDASGVDETQVAEEREYVKSLGLTGVSVEDNGQMRYSDNRQRAEYLRHIGLYDRNCGYSGAQPQNR